MAGPFSSPRPRFPRLIPTAAVLVAVLGLSGCYYPYGPYGYPGYGYAPVAVPAPIVVGRGYYGGGYYGGGYRGWR